MPAPTRHAAEPRSNADTPRTGQGLEEADEDDARGNPDGKEQPHDKEENRGKHKDKTLSLLVTAESIRK